MALTITFWTKSYKIDREQQIKCGSCGHRFAPLEEFSTLTFFLRLLSFRAGAYFKGHFVCTNCGSALQEQAEDFRVEHAGGQWGD